MTRNGIGIFNHRITLEPHLSLRSSDTLKSFPLKLPIFIPDKYLFSGSITVKQSQNRKIWKQKQSFVLLPWPLFHFSLVFTYDSGWNHEGTSGFQGRASADKPSGKKLSCTGTLNGPP